MGTPLDPVIITPGNDCNQCWGTGKPYTLPTPKFIQMQFFDWTEATSWNEDYRAELSSALTLEQNIGFPCTWAALSEHFGWLLIYHAGFTECLIALRPAGFVYAFLAGPVDLCIKHISNEAVEPPARITTGGYVQITFGAPE